MRGGSKYFCEDNHTLDEFANEVMERMECMKRERIRTAIIVFVALFASTTAVLLALFGR